MNIRELCQMLPSVLSGECCVGIFADACEECDDRRLDEVVKNLRAIRLCEVFAVDESGRKKGTWQIHFKDGMWSRFSMDSREQAEQLLRDRAVQVLHEALPSVGTLPAFYRDVLVGWLSVFDFSLRVEEAGLKETARWLRRLQRRKGHLPAGVMGVGGGPSLIIAIGHQLDSGWDMIDEVPDALIKRVYEGHDPLGFVAVKAVKQQIETLGRTVEAMKEQYERI